LIRLFLLRSRDARIRRLRWLRLRSRRLLLRLRSGGLLLRLLSGGLLLRFRSGRLLLRRRGLLLLRRGDAILLLLHDSEVLPNRAHAAGTGAAFRNIRPAQSERTPLRLPKGSAGAAAIVRRFSSDIKTATAPAGNEKGRPTDSAGRPVRAD